VALTDAHVYKVNMNDEADFGTLWDKVYKVNDDEADFGTLWDKGCACWNQIFLK